MATKDKDYRLITLISDICPLPLRKFFLNLAQSDPSPGVPFTTLDIYMAFRKLDVEKLVKLPPKSIRKYQFNLIYPKADETQWDISLLSGLLLGLFGSQMQNGEDQLIKIIREIRNKLQHKPGSVATEDGEFDTVWNDIETATLTLAQIVGGTTYENEIRVLIDAVKINNLPKLGDTLKTWYEDIIVQLRNEIEELKDTSKKSLGILEATTVKRKAASGGKSKRQKIDDPVLKKLRGHFEKTLTRELPEDFEPHEEEATVRRKLRENHYVVVSGYENTSYLATTLSAIKRSDNYIISRCVEITKADDWTHVDPDETDLVLFCEPFQDHIFQNDPNNQRNLCKMFQSMRDSAKMPDKESRIDVVIVSEHALVETWKGHNDTQLFEDVVELYTPTEEENPLDVEKRYKSCKRRGASDVLGNMLAYSEAYIKQWRTDETDQELMDSAREKFKKHKALVITGPKGSGKTNFAVNLVSTCYEQNQCVVLTETSEWKHVILGEISVIIIDEFAGKFKYNAYTAEGWLNKFDLIYAAVVQGKLNVIVTCETTRFAKVLKTCSGHALLNHRIKLPGSGFGNAMVKDEPLSPDPYEPDVSEMDELGASDESTQSKGHGSSIQKQEDSLLQCGPLFNLESGGKTFNQFCEMPDGTVVSTYHIYTKSPYSCRKDYVAIFTTGTRNTEVSVELPYQLRDISVVDDHEIVMMLMGNDQKMLHATVGTSSIELGEIKDIPISHDWIRMIRVQEGKYIMCTTIAVFIYDLSWTKTHEITQHCNKPLFYLSFPSNESKPSKKKHITDLVAVTNAFFVSSNEKVVVFDFDGNVMRTIETEASSISAYNDQLLFVCSGKIISVYSVENLKGILFQGTSEAIRIFYAKKSKTIFIKTWSSWKTASIEYGV